MADYSYIFVKSFNGWKRWSGPWKNESVTDVLNAIGLKQRGREFCVIPQIPLRAEPNRPWAARIPDYAALPTDG